MQVYILYHNLKVFGLNQKVLVMMDMILFLQDGEEFVLIIPRKVSLAIGTYIYFVYV